MLSRRKISVIWLQSMLPSKRYNLSTSLPFHSNVVAAVVVVVVVVVVVRSGKELPQTQEQVGKQQRNSKNSNFEENVFTEKFMLIIKS